jgi:hypothetical protein
MGLNEEQVQAEMQSLYAEGDRLIGRYILGHALLAILLAGVHGTWEATLIVTAAMLGIFFVAARRSPRSFLTRCLGGVALQTFVALHVYQMHGELEVRFLFFPALMMMVVYQDWACLVPAALVAFGERVVLLVLYYTGMPTYLFEDDHITAPKVVSRVGIGLIHLGVCAYWAHLTRKRTLHEAWQRHELQVGREFAASQL